MSNGVYVQVPRDLATVLEEDDFTVAGGTWGAGSEAVVLVGSVVGIGAQLTTILLARHDVARFVRHAWMWATRRHGDKDRELKIEIRVGEGKFTMTCEVEHLDSEAAMQVVTTVLTPALTKLVEAND